MRPACIGVPEPGWSPAAVLNAKGLASLPVATRCGVLDACPDRRAKWCSMKSAAACGSYLFVSLPLLTLGKPLSVHRRPVIGYPEDIERVGRREVQAFFQRHYGPSNLTIAVRCYHIPVCAAPGTHCLPHPRQCLTHLPTHPPDHPPTHSRWQATCGQARSAAWLSATLAAGGRMRSPPAHVRAAAPAGWKLWRPHPPHRQNGSIEPNLGRGQRLCMPTTGPASGTPTR